MADDAEYHPHGDLSLVSANTTNQSVTDQPFSGDSKSPKRRRIEHSPTPSPVFSSYQGPLWNDSEQTNVHMKMVSLEKRFLELEHDEKKLNSTALVELAKLITTVKQYKIVLDQIHNDQSKTMKGEISKKDQEIENLKERCKNLDGKLTYLFRGLRWVKGAITRKDQEIKSLKEQLMEVDANLKTTVEELKIAKTTMAEKKLAVLQNPATEKGDETEPQAQKDSVTKEQQCSTMAIGDEELSLHHKHKKLKILYKELIEKYESLVAENSKLHWALPRSSKDLGEAQAKKNQHLRDYENLKQENRKLIDEKKDLENHLSKLRQANSYKETQKTEAMSQLNQANDHVVELKRANSVLEEQKVDAVSQLDYANDLVVKLKEAYSVLENKKMEATSQLNHTKKFVNSHLEALHVELNKSNAMSSQQMKPQEGSSSVTSDSDEQSIGEMKNEVKTELPEPGTDIQLLNSETMVDQSYEDGEIKIEIPETDMIPQENTNVHDKSVSAGKSASTDE